MRRVYLCTFHRPRFIPEGVPPTPFPACDDVTQDGIIITRGSPLDFGWIAGRKFPDGVYELICPECQTKEQRHDLST